MIADEKILSSVDYINNIIKFKKWLFRFYFKGASLVGNRVLLPNAQKTADILKIYSSWIQWFCVGKNNSKPKSLPMVPGWDHKSSSLGLIVFRGTIYHRLYQPYNHALSRDERKTLLQMIFGRALPPPLFSKLEESMIENNKILFSQREYSLPNSIVLGALSFVSKRWRKPKMNTHFSVSNSSTFQDAKLGRSGVISKSVSFFRSKKVIDFVQEYETYDCFGNLFLMKKEAYVLGESLQDSLIEHCYPRLGGNTNIRQYTKEFFGMSNIGYLISLDATRLALGKGIFLTDYKNDLIDRFLFRKEELPVTYFPLSYPKTRITCLSEPSNKARTLGISEHWLITLLQLIRHRIEPCFYADFRTGFGFRAAHKLWELYKKIFWLRKGKKNFYPKNFFCLNTDLKSATDYIPLRLIKTVWRYILSFLFKKDDPIMVFRNLIWCPRDIVIAKKFKHLKLKEGYHKCGSFMGEPCSFITLTLINVVAFEVTVQCTMNDLKPCLITSFYEYRWYFCVICGDDMFSYLPYKSYKVLHDVYRLLGSITSPGKDSSSRDLAIFCECYMFITSYMLEFIDIVKLRLLTPMSRLHRDCRASVIGRGHTLTKYLSWNPNKIIRKISYKCMGDMYRSKIEKSLWRDFPLQLPISLGGIDLPIGSMANAVRRYPKYIRCFEVLLAKRFETRVFWAYSIRSLTDRRPRVIPLEDPLDVLHKMFGFSPIVKESLVIGNDGFPIINRNSFYSSKAIFSYIKKTFKTVRRRLDGGIEYSHLYELAEDHLGLITLDKVIDSITRIKSFYKLLTEEHDASRKVVLKFSKYLRKWDKLMKLFIQSFYDGHPVSFANLPDKEIERSIRKLGTSLWASSVVFISNTSPLISIINEGPNLRIRYDLNHLNKDDYKMYDALFNKADYLGFISHFNLPRKGDRGSIHDPMVYRQIFKASLALRKIPGFDNLLKSK
jgi:hypothetical protein